MVSRKAVVPAALAGSVVALAAVADEAQQSSLKRATLQTGEFPPGYETVMIVAQMEPGKCSGWHTHPGLESSYFLEGEVLIHFAGQTGPGCQSGATRADPSRASAQRLQCQRQAVQGSGALYIIREGQAARVTCSGPGWAAQEQRIDQLLMLGAVLHEKVDKAPDLRRQMMAMRINRVH